MTHLILFALFYFSTITLFAFLFINYKNKHHKTALNSKLKSDFEKFSIIASKTDNGILICDPTGRIEWSNEGMTRLLGYELNEILSLGSTLQEVSSNPDIVNIIESVHKTRHSTNYESLNKRKDGSDIWLQSSLTPIIENDEIKNLILIITNIHERKYIENQLRQKNKDFTDSVNYAKRIQKAVFPLMENILRSLPDSFILFRPKDIVSGDFYGFTKKEGKIILAVGDCTGHGVPGAFMSMIGLNILNHLVMGKSITVPAQILNGLHVRIRKALKQDSSLNTDGMDIAIIAIDQAKSEIEFAGAIRSLYLVKKTTNDANSKFQLEEIKGNKHSIGGKLIEREHVFLNHRIKYNKGDTLYMFTDGYSDQFGGPAGKKFLVRRLKEKLLSIQHLDMPAQETFLSETLESWKGNNEQVDDILVVGIKL
jgi:PAS domain S-box-containing protein